MDQALIPISTIQKFTALVKLDVLNQLHSTSGNISKSQKNHFMERKKLELWLQYSSCYTFYSLLTQILFPISFWFDSIRFDSIRFDSIQFNSIQFNSIIFHVLSLLLKLLQLRVRGCVLILTNFTLLINIIHYMSKDK